MSTKPCISTPVCIAMQHPDTALTLHSYCNATLSLHHSRPSRTTNSTYSKQITYIPSPCLYLSRCGLLLFAIQSLWSVTELRAATWEPRG